jgi:hypothetical protein
MPAVPVPISQLGVATLPLSGSERLVVVQNGSSKQTTVSAASGKSSLATEIVSILAAGNNINIPVGSAAGRVLCNTVAGDATATGFAAGFDGQLVLVTNTGPNLLVASPANGLSLAANQLYGVTDLTYLSHESFLMSYSASLAKWVIA